MTQTEVRKIEKTLIKRVDQGDQKAVTELVEFQKACEETRKNLASEELEKERIQNDQEKIETEKERIEAEKLKIESQETVAKCQRDLDEQRLVQEKEMHEQRMKVEKSAQKWAFIGSIMSFVGTLTGGLISTIVGYKMFDKQATKAYKFEETGTISSFTSKQVLSGLKTPKK